MARRLAGAIGVLGLILLHVPSRVESSPEKSLNLRGSYGLVRMKSAPALIPFDYQIASSIEYFYQSDLFDDTDAGETAQRTRGTIAFSLAPTDFLTTAALIQFSDSTFDPSGAGNTFTSGTLKSALSVAAMTDLKRWAPSLEAGLLSLGLNLWIEFSQITRFFTHPIINPCLIVSSDLRPLQVPLRLHLNTELRMAGKKRAFSQAAIDSGLTDWDLFAMNATNQIGVGVSFGIEAPFERVVPSVEWDFHYLGQSFLKNPSVVTAGIKVAPFAYENILLTAAVDIGLNSHDDPDATDALPGEVPATPLWNIALGVTIQSFARKQKHVTIPEEEWASLQRKLETQHKVLAKIEADVKFNRLHGSVKDAETKQPLPGVRIYFPNNPEIREIETDAAGRFLQHYAAFDRNMVTFSKAGYAETSKFLVLKPGESIELQIELAKATAREEDGLLSLTVLDRKNAPIQAIVKVTHLKDRQERTFETAVDGTLLKPLKPGDYRLEIAAPKMKPQSLTLTIVGKEKIIKQAILVRDTR